MVCGTFVLDNVPNSDVNMIVNGFLANIPPPTRVGKTQNDDGTWKVTAVWPPCAGGVVTEHSAEGEHA